MLRSFRRLQKLLLGKNGCNMYRHGKMPVKNVQNNCLSVQSANLGRFSCCRQLSFLSCQMNKQSLALVFIYHHGIVERSSNAHRNTRIISPTNHRSKQREEPIRVPSYLMQLAQSVQIPIHFGIASHWSESWREIFKPTYLV